LKTKKEVIAIAVKNDLVIYRATAFVSLSVPFE